MTAGDVTDQSGPGETPLAERLRRPILADDAEGLLALIGDGTTMKGGRVGLAQALTPRVAAGGAIAARLADLLPPGHHLAPVANLVQGLHEIRAGHPGAVARLQAVARAELAAIRAGRASDPFEAFALPTGNIEDDAWVGRLEPDPARLPGAGRLLCHDPAPSPGAPVRPVLMIGCDPHYFNAFGAAALATLAAQAPGSDLHLHLVGPAAAGPAVQALRPQFPALRILVSTEDWAGAGPLHYSCARFVHAPLLLDRYRRDLLLLDIDQVLTRPLEPVIAASAGADLALFERPDDPPWLTCPAALLRMGCGGRGRRLAALVSAYIQAKIDGDRFWTLDQTALWAARRHLIQHDPGFRFVDLGRALGLTMQDFVAEQGRDAMKRRQTQVKGVDF